MDLDDFQRQVDVAITVANRHLSDLLARPGVVAVGVGPERRGGVMTGRAAVVVTVRRRRDADKTGQGGDRNLPTELEGVPVDVVQEGAPVEAPEIVAAQAVARATLEEVAPAYLRRPGITGLGIGYKTVAGQLRTNQVALIVFVAEKVPAEDLEARGLEPIPPTINGTVTDVEELKAQRPTASASGSRDDRKDPLVGGISIGVGSKPFWRGTLGAICFDRGDGRRLVLSNQHVLDAPAGTDVIQPAPVKLDDSVEVGFQLDVCNPLHFIRLDTPNTTVGTVLAGAAAAAALAAALSDVIDPTRRGQEATPPPAGATTLREEHRVQIKYPELPVPGTHFQVDTAWEYTRHTDQGDASHSVSETQTNEHALADKLLITDRRAYSTGDVIRLFGLILPEGCQPGKGDQDPERPIARDELEDLTRGTPVPPSATFQVVAEALSAAAAPPAEQPVAGSPGEIGAEALAAVANKVCRCDRFHTVALLTPTRVDRAFPVVLREPPLARRNELLQQLLEVVRQRDDKELLTRVFRLVRYGCLRYGELTVSSLPVGPWKHYLHVQTVNIAPEGMDPVLAARIIGGLPVSQNMRPVIDVACGPFVVEDGQFDIELI